MTNEEAYDLFIAPHMTQIIKVCREYKIPMFAQFQIEPWTKESPSPLMCSTVLSGENASPQMKSDQDNLGARVKIDA